MADHDFTQGTTQPAVQAIPAMAAQLVRHTLPLMRAQQAPVGHLLVADPVTGAPQRLMVYAEGERAISELLKTLDALGLSARLTPVLPGGEPATKSS
jgi:hypothetical protein